MNKKGFKKKLASILIFVMLLAIVPIMDSREVSANAPNGILGNGTSGIYIDINAAPFTTYANKSYGHLAYTSTGCTWFAAARVNQLTGKTPEIMTGKTWYNSYYANFGFTRGQAVKAKALACYEGHVAVVEKVSGNTVTVSEGGYVSAGVNYGYCKLHTMSIESLESARNGAFLGYVYLGETDSTVQEKPNPVTGITQSLDMSNGKLTISWNASNVGKGGYYELVLMDNYWKTISTTKVTTTSTTIQLERDKIYAFRIHARNIAGDYGWGEGIWAKCWNPEKPNPVTGITQSLDMSNGKLTISWNASNVGKGGYYELVLMDNYWNTISTTKVTTTSTTIQLERDEIYAFKIHARNIAGDYGRGEGVWAKVWNPIVVEETTTKPKETTKLDEITTHKGANVGNNFDETTKKSVAIVTNNKVSKVKKIKAKKKSLKVTWKKVNGVKGYQIEYSLKKSFKKSKIITIAKGTTSSKTIKKLKTKKKYFIRIRTYVVFNGEKIYSKWSKTKSRKTK